MKLVPILVSLLLIRQLQVLRYVTDHKPDDVEKAAAVGTVDDKPSSVRPVPHQATVMTELPSFPYMPNSLKEAMQLIMWYRQQERATFIQIGANDGVTNDPLYIALGLDLLESRWIGLQVEPAPMLFTNVTNLHSNASGWSFYNGAMANSTQCRNGTVTFMESPQSGVGDHWSTQGQVNTLNAKTPHRGVLVPTRSCLASFDDLLKRYASPELVRRTFYNSAYHVDLLIIDVEGFDDKVIELINWDTLSPHCIHFETFHINATYISSFLIEKGYTLRVDAMDTLACHVTVAANANVTAAAALSTIR